jgi:hypothetical protein
VRARLQFRDIILQPRICTFLNQRSLDKSCCRGLLRCCGLWPLSTGLQATGIAYYTSKHTAGFFVCTNVGKSGEKSRKRMINSKQSCTDSLSASISRTANWRRGLQAKFPGDNRNKPAAEMLEQFADETYNLSDEAWSQLQPFYSWGSETWNEAVSETSRRVVFKRNIRTFPDFVNNLVGILSERHVSH